MQNLLQLLTRCMIYINIQQETMNQNTQKLISKKAIRQNEYLTQPLISLSKYNISNQQNDNSQIDVVRLINKQQQSRMTQVNLNIYEHVKKQEHKQNLVTDYHGPGYIKEQDQQDDGNYSTVFKIPDNRNSQSRLTEHQSFISSYQSNHIIGTIIYLLFIIFIAVQIIVTTYIVTKHNQNSNFIRQQSLLIILTSQLVYYLSLRYINPKTKNKLFKQNSAFHSFRKVLSQNNYCKVYSDQRNTLIRYTFERPYFVLFIVSVCVVGSQIIYCWLASQSILLFHSGPNKYLIPTIYWSNLVLPILVGNFFMNRPVGQSSLKVKIFSYILLGFMFQSIIESILFAGLILFKVIYAYIQSKQGFQIFHVDQLIKAVLLVFVFIFTIIKSKVSTKQSIISFDLFITIIAFLINVAIVASSMLVTRILGLIFLKEELYRKYFYTETHINLALVFATIFMNTTYLNFWNQAFNSLIIYRLIGIFFLIIIAILIYIEGKQRQQVKITIDINGQNF